MTGGDRACARRRRMEEATRRVHDALRDLFRRLDPAAEFREDPWTLPGGSGGRTRAFLNGAVWEKAAAGRSVVSGPLTAAMRAALLLAPQARGFFATGVSVIVHPASPLVPGVHFNVRYFELEDGDGRVCDAWFGGGVDLSPTYPFPEDFALFHRRLRELCDRHSPGLYGLAKADCDRYFANAHRDGQARGVGGLFFDHWREGAGPLGTLAAAEAFCVELADAWPRVYEEIVARRRTLPFGERERRYQLHRRARYAEFNLLHDRGTRFGLESGARVESVLASLPPQAAWLYDARFESGSPEARMEELLRPRDWVGEAAPAGRPT